jgi:6-phosphogluconolactonase
MGGHGELMIAHDLADLVWRAGEAFVTGASEAISANGIFHVALSGGSTPLPLYALLALPEWAARVEWSRVHIYWVDERCVPPDHADSNYRLAHESLLARVPILTANIHRIRGEIDPAQAAVEYEKVIAGVRFDLILLGMGDDGHTASLFPGSPAIHEQTRRVMAQYVAPLGAWRITLTPAAINDAAQVLFMVAGAGKAERLHEVLRGPYRPDSLPAQVVQPKRGRLDWLVDRDAAARLA